MRIAIRPVENISAEEYKRIDDVVARAFAGQGDDGYEWGGGQWELLVEVGGELASCLQITERLGTVGGHPVKLGGIGGVATLPEYRGRGLAGAALGRAAAFMRDDLGVEFGLLLCGPAMIPFYTRFGWQVAEGPLTFDQSWGKATYHMVTMILSCCGRAWPQGTIDLCGLPW